ncbi:MAG TPA: cupin domain-containing protein [Longimicrobiales bacterium]
MDPLSDVLRVIRLTGAVFFTTRLAEPWCFRSPPPRELAPARGWLEMTLRYAIEEAEGRRPGSPAMLARLAELLYLEVPRQYMRRLPDDRTGWLAGVRHPEVGRALRLLHEQPERD